MNVEPPIVKPVAPEISECRIIQDRKKMRNDVNQNYEEVKDGNIQKGRPEKNQTHQKRS